MKASRLDLLRAEPRAPGEASIFYYDGRLESDAVKVLPGEYFVHDHDLAVLTTLGSCISACLWDRQAQLGGMNHFMLPEGGSALASDAGRYGCWAMELLINQLMKRGAARHRLEAKVFGGGHVLGAMHSINIGERNTRFVLDYLHTERIPVVSMDVQGAHARKVCFLPATGKAMVKRLATAPSEALLASTTPAPRAGSIQLFQNTSTCP